MKRSILVTVFVIASITVISGLVEGTLSGRWGPSPDLIAAGESLDRFPREFGDWTVSSESEMAESVKEELQCTGSMTRTYVNGQTGQVIRIAMIVGPPGPTAVHVPEICYSSQAYTQEGERERVHVEAADGSRQGDFWALTFRPNDLNGYPLRVYYAWSDGHQWQAVENPRVSLSGEKVLYKLQLAADVRGGLSAGANGQLDPCLGFVESLLAAPELPGSAG